MEKTPPDMLQPIYQSYIHDIKKKYFSKIPKLIDARAYGLYLFNPENYSLFSFDGIGASKEFLEDYELFGRSVDPLLKNIKVTHKTVHNYTNLSKMQWKKHKLHTLLNDHGFKCSMQSPIIVKEKLVGTINFARHKTTNPFKEKDIQIAQNLTELLSISIECAIQTETQKQICNIIKDKIDNLNQGIISLNFKGEVLFSNYAGKHLMNVKLSNQLSIIEVLKKETEKIKYSSEYKQKATYNLHNSQEIILIISYKLPDLKILYFISEHKNCTWENLKKLLTQRELEIVYWVCIGYKTTDIARKLFISPYTVQQHLKNIYKKANVTSRTQLASIARSEPF